MTTQVGPVTEQSGLPGGVSAVLDVTAPVVVKATAGLLCRVICVAAGTGNVVINDCATTGTAAAANQIFAGALTAGQIVEMDWPCGTGITISAVPASYQLAVSYV